MVWKEDRAMASHILSYTYVDIETGDRVTFGTYEEFYAHYVSQRARGG